MTDLKLLDELQESREKILQEIHRVVVGQENIIDQLLLGLFSAGHCLLVGVPGLAKTLMVRTLAKALDLTFKRIQFTPDLMPSDITGTEVIQQDAVSLERSFKFVPGPIFANLVLADEINRSPARTQAALLEVMQERQITVGGQTYFLPKPFIIIATQNSLDTEGVFHLGEAQVDRFLMMIEQEYPTEDEEREILYHTTGVHVPQVERVTGPEEILAMQRFAKEVPVV
ncbi:MAG: AAA family ATPase, partial [Candidatus Omnitrophica bacterium]|nr:AAA family ATPase [Candidatus Omnitrophota bacterium]